MSRTSQHVQVGKRKLELSNLDKILYPDEKIIKAEIIEYYLKIAPTILKHIKGRPLSLVRFPDGITGEKFFQKNRPDWAPSWIEYVTLGSDEKKDYILGTEDATLVWLANLACLELHEVHSKQPHLDKPDYIVYDLDPPEGYSFEKVVQLALDMKEHIESFGYHTFAKTTGGKGIHIVTPITAEWDFHTAFEAAQDVAKPFVEANNATTTLHIKKDARKGRVLIDIYRNRPQQTIIAPYSLRGNPGAPVSMPLRWDELETVTNPKDYDLRNVLDKVMNEGDAWEGIAAYSVDLHTKRKVVKTKSKPLKATGKHKTPEQLEAYSKKRDFEKTPEPGPAKAGGTGNSFVVHRHHASHLHYDLRLEQDGTLKSWAVPKGLPPKPGIKRLAVATEDHPLEYLTFEGKIPKGQYGGGDMWIFANGKYEITKEKKDGFYFQLHSPEMNGEYRVHLMKNKEWLMERVDTPQVDWLQHPMEPMLAQLQKAPPVSDDYIFEVKWDGIRAMISLDEGQVTIRSRSQRDISHLFPELKAPEAFRATSALLDTEIVCLDPNGKPDFKQVINRLMQSTESGIERGVKKHPAYCYAFDCLFLDGRPVMQEPLLRRKEWLKSIIKKDTAYRFSETITEGKELFDAAKKLGLEGIMAKVKDSKYFPGKRSDSWLKIKVRQTAESHIIGYTKGKGNRNDVFGALHLADKENGEWIYRGKVGTGFNDQNMKEIHDQLKEIKTTKRPVKERPVDEAQTTWIEPKLICELEYASMTNNGTYREPVFLRLRPDL